MRESMLDMLLPPLRQLCSTASARAAFTTSRLPIASSVLSHATASTSSAPALIMKMSGHQCMSSQAAPSGGSSRPASRLSNMPGASAPATPAPDPLAGSVAGSLPKGFWAARQAAMNAIPPVPKLLGFAGAIPFLALHPSVAVALGFEEYARDFAAGQVAYGALIVSFLGAVHWGIALNSTLSGANARLVQRERYVWSVFPALAAWPALLMEPGPGSFCIALLLGICYMSDKAHFKQGSLPAWYMTLRGYLTTMAGLSMLATAAWFFAQDFEKMRKRMEEDDRRKAAQVEAQLAPAFAGRTGATALAAGAAGPAAWDVPPLVASNAVASAVLAGPMGAPNSDEMPQTTAQASRKRGWLW